MKNYNAQKTECLLFGLICTRSLAKLVNLFKKPDKYLIDAVYRMYKINLSISNDNNDDDDDDDTKIGIKSLATIPISHSKGDNNQATYESTCEYKCELILNYPTINENEFNESRVSVELDSDSSDNDETSLQLQTSNSNINSRNYRFSNINSQFIHPNNTSNFNMHYRIPNNQSYSAINNLYLAPNHNHGLSRARTQIKQQRTNNRCLHRAASNLSIQSSNGRFRRNHCPHRTASNSSTNRHRNHNHNQCAHHIGSNYQKGPKYELCNRHEKAFSGQMMPQNGYRNYNPDIRFNRQCSNRRRHF